MPGRFSSKLLEWHDPALRNLPWKKSSDPYKIWLSEIILQQTRVEQGTPYYLAFVKRFPTIKKLAEAEQDDVLKLWEGLGYYSRARNLHEAAKQVMQKHKGKFPSTHEEILSLKGVGSYTAAAISSFAFHLPHAVVDGNVYRFLARMFGIGTPIDSTEGRKQFAELAQRLIDKKNASSYNQAIMDFGSQVCKPRDPLCHECPFSPECKALEKGLINQLPVKSKKIVKEERHFHYFVMHDEQHIFIRQRIGQDIWKGLYEFPMFEGFRLDAKAKNLIPVNFSEKPFVYKQVLSHQLINGKFYELKLEKKNKIDGSFLKINKRNIAEYAFPKIVRSYLRDRLNSLS